MKIIGKIYTDFPEKFGVPRQSGLVPELKGKIVFEKEYRNIDAFRGITDFSHIWVLWQFSMAIRDEWSPTVKPPRLGGNKRMGVFATRSPFRPNPIGMSSLRLEELVIDKNDGPVLMVSGVDMISGTPIYDIKPYLPYADCHTDATAGFASQVKDYELEVEFEGKCLDKVPEEYRDNLVSVLRQDPRPGYIEDDREFGISFAGMNVRFVVKERVLIVVCVEEL